MKPKYKIQNYYIDILFFIGGAISLGTVFGVLKDSFDFLPNSKTAFILAITLALVYLMMKTLLGRIGIPWKHENLDGRMRRVPRQVSMAFYGMIALLLITSIKGITKKQENIICDRDSSLGCTIDFSPNKIMNQGNITSGNTQSSANEISIPMSTLTIYSGDRNLRSFISSIDNESFNIRFPNKVDSKPNSRTFFEFPDENLIKNNTGPFTLKVVNDRVHFSGKLKDLKTKELLGWFDENEFSLVVPCGFSWNKDAEAIEIIDRYNFVCFSIQVVNNNDGGSKLGKGLKFKGYFEENGVYYIYNETMIITQDLQEAENLISKIKPIFDHFGENSLGKRLFYESQ